MFFSYRFCFSDKFWPDKCTKNNGKAKTKPASGKKKSSAWGS